MGKLLLIIFSLLFLTLLYSNVYALYFTNTNEVMILTESTFSGNYTSVTVPEHATLFLLGTGMIGFAGIGRQKIRK